MKCTHTPAGKVTPHLGYQHFVFLLPPKFQERPGVQAFTEHDSEVLGGRASWGLCRCVATYLAQRGQHREINGLSVPQDAHDAIQVHLVLAEAACKNENQQILPQSFPTLHPNLGHPSDSAAPTWLGGIRLSSLGTDAVLPAYILILHILCQILEELAEGHVCSLVDSVIQQGCTPQERLLPKQHTMQAGQALLSGVGRPKPILESAFSAVPRLSRIVHTTQIVGACRKDEEGAELTPRKSSRDSSCPQIHLMQDIPNPYLNSFSPNSRHKHFLIQGSLLSTYTPTPTVPYLTLLETKHMSLSPSIPVPNANHPDGRAKAPNKTTSGDLF